ncbi:hypothetical protein QA640_03280 [Bradyrhizobium sp. CB82]|uniref:hypothetical protein n=1 Tax=Bradyrhizobium sp. CB82 TaxID=3039159 RepID=UPI0024B1ECCF|nr:hypothetical protein [Bradyrhizobium sp. CB82]WFU41565.1 hypothetical protein QA640_03280 [Bradyrhizobium sp. CB82]
MATDVLVSRELKSLQDELASARKNRTAVVEQSAAASPAPASGTEASTPDEAELQGYLRQLADEVTELFGEAEKSVSDRSKVPSRTEN